MPVRLTRRIASLALAALLLSFAPLARAGTYLDGAALLLGAARIERDAVRAKSNDKELVRMVLAIAKARSDAAREMTVPKSVAAAHPHLLLVLENCERAYAAALAGHSAKFVEHIERARSEDATFRAVVRDLGYTLR